MGTLKKMRCGKAPELDGIAQEILQYGEERIIECLLRILYRCMEISTVAED